MRRSVATYSQIRPAAVASQSPAAMTYFAEDARSDILTLSAIVLRVVALNPDAGEIGAGMLKSLVEDARKALELKP